MTHDHLAAYSQLWRLILARLEFDDDAKHRVFAEVGNCEQCWQEIAFELAKQRADGMAIGCGTHAIGPEAAKRHCEQMILGALDAAARDRREIEERSGTGSRAPLHQDTGNRVSESNTAPGIEVTA